MEGLWGGDGLTKFYLVCAILGASVFILRSVLMVLGAHTGDFDVSVHDGVYDPAAFDLTLVTVQGVTAFIMMFGLTGYAVHTGSALASIWVFLISGAVGVVAMWFVAFGFKMMKRLESDGSMDFNQAVGEHGSVYLRIPINGVGKVQVKIGQNLRVVDAVSDGDVELHSGDRIIVIAATDDGALVVRKGER